MIPVPAAVARNIKNAAVLTLKLFVKEPASTFHS
jgi:hypothetical protein